MRSATLNLYAHLFVVVCCTIAPASAGAQHEWAVAEIFSDDMVLQQGMDIPVWGTAEPGTSVRVTFTDQAHTSTADASGHWRIELAALSASNTPRTLRVQAGEQSIAFERVLVGEVWLLAGQSNMEFALRSTVGGERAIEQLLATPGVRLWDPQPSLGGGPSAWPLEVVQQMSPDNYFKPALWQPPTPEAAGRFSGVGAYFALHLRSELDAPIGLIDVAVGGTPAEAWVPRARILADPELAPLETEFLDTPLVQSFVRDRPRAQLARWLDAGRPGAMPEHPYRPGFMYEAAIAQVAPFPIAGVLWYQGESNAEDPGMYPAIFRQAVAAWRQAFGRADLPVLTVQLPELNRANWPEFREAQQQLSDEMPNVHLAVSLGTGHPTDVHPRDKRPVGERLARLALHRVYQRDVADQGPRVRRHDLKGGSMRIEFEHVARGLVVKRDEAAAGSTPPPTGFWIAGADRVFHRAQVDAVDTESVTLSHPRVPEPVAARYAWEANAPATLLNDQGLPAAPFRTDDWPTIRIACVGDSITHGTGTANPDSQSYPAQLSQMLGPLFDVRRFGVPGSGVVNGLLQPGTGWDRGYATQFAFQRSLVFQPDVVIINLGINDVTNPAFDIEAFVDDYTALIQAYRALESEPTIIIWQQLAPLFPGQRFFEHPTLAKIQQALDQIANQTKAHTLDMRTPLLDAGESFPDHLHPNAAGAAIIANTTRMYLRGLDLPALY